MDAAVQKRGSLKRRLAAVVRTLAATAERLVETLAGAAGTDGAGFGREIERCRAVWPVEGGTADEVVKSVALLLVLRRVTELCLGKSRASWEALEGAGEGIQALVEISRRAEASAKVESSLAELNGQLPVDFPRLAEAVGRELDAVHPLSVVYEQLLAKFDRRQRAARGVYHTPRPVVRWMVNSVRYLIEEQFPEAENLRFVDMGCGCGSFLSELRSSFGQVETLSNQRSTFVGYEVLPVSLAMARWLLAYPDTQRPSEVETVWANPLLRGETEAHRILDSDALPVLIGNPPYANFGRANRGPWIDELLQDYKRGLGERKTNLDDDFIKFIRWGQYWIDRAGQGILAVVTSSTYLAGLTHRRMRQSLLGSFDQMYLLDLHGDMAGTDASSDDENVFAVRSGVAIALFVKSKRPGSRQRVKHFDIRGFRPQKLDWLDRTPMTDVRWHLLQPREPTFSFAKPTESQTSRSSNYADFWPVTRIFKRWISGVQTKHDALFVDVDRTRLAKRISDWLDGSYLTTRTGARSNGIEFYERLIQPYLVAPFDRRWIYYDPRLLGRARHEVMRHMLQPNLGLVFMRQSTNVGEYDQFLVVDCLVSDRVFYSRHGAPYMAPLWLYSTDPSNTQRQTNFTDEWFAEVANRVAIEPTAESLFDFLYATTYRTSYRQQFAAELRTDFPRIPVPSNGDQFYSFSSVGQRLRTLHTVMLPAENQRSGDGEIPGSTKPPCSIGGYDVLKRLKKRRADRDPSPHETEYEKLVKHVLAETLRLRAELDALD